ncbi:MAG: SDR family oxidoreductase [bacterium]|nr:SDR family oxidoreductase [bacterium]
MDHNKIKTALITGSSRGIGAAAAAFLGKNRCNVIINYNSSKDSAEDLKSQINGDGGNAIAVKADVTLQNEVKHLISEGIDAFGKIDILVNNVGDFLYKEIGDITVDEWKRIIDSNLNSALYSTKEILPGMREKKWGRIINIGVAGLNKLAAQPMITPYMIAKTGLLQLTRSLAVAEASNGITVNMVSPGLIDCGNYSGSFKEKIVEEIPAGKLGYPSDIANAVLFLAQEDSSYITGANIEVCGGAYL